VSELWENVLGLMTRAEEFIVIFAETAWLYAGIFVVSLIDGFLPVVPSDAILIGASTAWQQSGNGLLQFENPMLIGIVLAAAAGAWLGDQTAYLIGSKIDVRKLRIFRGDKGLALLNWAEHALEHRGTSFIIAVRFIPMGRVAVNITAGALRYPRGRFMGVDAVGVSLWALWSVALGTFAASIFEGNLLLAITAGVVGGVLAGVLVDKIMTRLGLTPVNLPDLAGDIRGKDTEQPSE